MDLFKSRAHRDNVNAKVMKDPRLAGDVKAMPFDVKRMAYGLVRSAGGRLSSGGHPRAQWMSSSGFARTPVRVSSR